MIFYNKCCFLGQHDDLAIKEVQYSTIRMPDDFGISRVAKSSYWSKKKAITDTDIVNWVLFKSIDE